MKDLDRERTLYANEEVVSRKDKEDASIAYLFFWILMQSHVSSG